MNEHILNDVVDSFAVYKLITLVTTLVMRRNVQPNVKSI